MKLIKLSEYAKIHSVTYRTAWNWYRKGLIPNVKLMPSGTILVEIEDENDTK